MNSIFQRWNLRVRKPRLTETAALADDDDEDDEEEEEEMEVSDVVQETSVRAGKGRPSTTSHTHTSTPSAANTTSIKKTPAGRKPQQKKREGAELKAPPSKRKQGTALLAGAGATATPTAGATAGVSSGGGGAGGGATPSLAVLQMRKESRSYRVFQSVLSGKSALKVRMQVLYGRKFSLDRNFANVVIKGHHAFSTCICNHQHGAKKIWEIKILLMKAGGKIGENFLLAKISSCTAYILRFSIATLTHTHTHVHKFSCSL